VQLVLAGVAMQVMGITAADPESAYAPRRPSGSPKRSATEANANPATVKSFTRAQACIACVPRAARLSTSRSHRSVGVDFANTGRLVVESPCSQRKDRVPTWLWIVIIVVVVLAVLGYFGRGRFSR
jgi:cobalamin biosynthesis Mg chelatase CobN